MSCSLKSYTFIPIVQEHFLVDVDGFLVVCPEIMNGCQAQLRWMERGKEGGGGWGTASSQQGSHLVLKCVLQGLVVSHETLFISKLVRERLKGRRTWMMICAEWYIPCVPSEIGVCSAVHSLVL